MPCIFTDFMEVVVNNVGLGSYGQGKSGKIKVQGAKVKKNAETKFELLYTDCVQQFKKNFLHALLADYLYLHF